MESRVGVKTLYVVKDARRDLESRKGTEHRFMINFDRRLASPNLGKVNREGHCPVQPANTKKRFSCRSVGAESKLCIA